MTNETDIYRFLCIFKVKKKCSSIPYSTENWCEIFTKSSIFYRPSTSLDLILSCLSIKKLKPLNSMYVESFLFLFVLSCRRGDKEVGWNLELCPSLWKNPGYTPTITPTFIVLFELSLVSYPEKITFISRCSSHC